MAELQMSTNATAPHRGITKDTDYAPIAEKATPTHRVGSPWKSQPSEIDNWAPRGEASTATPAGDAE